MMRNFSENLLRPRSAAEFSHGQDPLQKSLAATPARAMHSYFQTSCNHGTACRNGSLKRPAS
jgi:hypothetical protein